MFHSSMHFWRWVLSQDSVKSCRSLIWKNSFFQPSVLCNTLTVLSLTIFWSIILAIYWLANSTTCKILKHKTKCCKHNCYTNIWQSQTHCLFFFNFQSKQEPKSRALAAFWLTRLRYFSSRVRGEGSCLTRRSYMINV